MTTLVPTGLFVISTLLYPARFSSSARCSSISRRLDISLMKYLVTDMLCSELVPYEFDVSCCASEEVGSSEGPRASPGNVRTTLGGRMYYLEPLHVQVPILSIGL